MPPISQANRSIRLNTDLAPDKLNFLRLTGHERMSGPFEFRVTAVSEDPAIDFDTLLGTPCSVVMEGVGGDPIRHFHGLCAQVTHGGSDLHGGYLYHLILRPEFWFLSRNRDYRIFQNMSVPDIISDVLQRRGLRSFDINCQDDYPKRIFCVQYNESDFAFLSRLMEEEGIFYFFRHEATAHRLVMGDSPSENKPCPGYETIRFVPPNKTMDREFASFDEWSAQSNVSAAATKLYGFDFEKPTAFTDAPPSDNYYAKDDAELMGQTGIYVDDNAKIRSESKRYAALLRDAERAHRVHAGASGDALGLMAGGTFTLSNLAHADGSYLIVEARHQIEGDAYHSGPMNRAPSRVDILASPVRWPYRPQRLTPKPFIAGPQTAIVVGKSGEEIDTDKYGRIKLRFHWDTYGPVNGKPESSSCWIRVAQYWAGKNWGAIFTPRIGQEVVVEFLDGNPDRPIVVGSVYNGEQGVPYSLPGKKMQSGLKSDSTKGSGGSNELRFDDNKGSEEVWLHAEKDMNAVIENNLDTKVKKDETRTITNNHETTITSGNQKLTISGGNRTTELSAGNDTTSLSAGKQATTAMQSIEFTVGSSSIKIDQMGVTIKGLKISIEGTVQTDVKGLLTNISGDAMLIAKGGITMIN